MKRDGLNCRESLEVLHRHTTGKIRVEILKGTLASPSAGILPPASRAIQRLKFLHFVLAEKWCVPGTSDPGTIKRGLARIGLTPSAIGGMRLDDYIDSVGYFEPEVDTDDRQVHVNLHIEELLAVTIRMRPLGLPKANHTAAGIDFDTLRSIPGSLCLAGPFADNIRHLEKGQINFIMELIKKGQLLELTSLASIFAASPAWREKLLNPEDEVREREACHRARDYLYSHFRERWPWFLLRYIFSLVAMETLKLNGKIVIVPSDAVQMKMYLATIGNDFAPCDDAFLYGMTDDPDHPPIVLGQGPMYSSLLEFVRDGDGVADITTRPDTGSVSIMCFPVHLRAVANALHGLDGMEHPLKDNGPPAAPATGKAKDQTA